MIKVPTYIQSVSINKDSIEIKEIILKNLPDSVLPTALKIENMIIEAPITTYLSDEIKLSSIICKDFFVGLEFESKGSSQGNWSILMENINHSAPSVHSFKKSVFIKKLIIKDATIHLTYKDQPNYLSKYTIKEIVLHDLSSEGEFPMDQLTKIIIRESLKEIFSLKNITNMFKNYILPKIPSSPFFPGNQLIPPFSN